MDAVLLGTAHKVLKEEVNLYPILKSNKPRLKQLFSDGFLKLSTLQENLKNDFLLPELKEILKENNLKISGKKDELIDRIVSNVEPEGIQSSKSKLKRFLLTKTGRDVIVTEDLRFLKELEEFYDLIYNLILSKNFEEAFKLVSALYKNSLKPCGFGKDWSLGFSEIDMRASKLLREFNFDQALLKTGIEEIRAELATYNLFRFNYFGDFRVEDRILKKFPDFESRYIKEYIENNPDGLASSFDANDQKDIIKLFVHYVHFTCFNEANLQDILSYRDKVKYGYKGVELATGDRLDCAKCRQIGLKKYSWNEIHRIPKIPFYPGCICYYSNLVET
ncbi:SAP domain-containing protein [Algoriphagus persicinus]|uniref:SAP domain-containing protein n=1 Tax=Algoriphagus persicinus TaxID=3108754 RepID=UPI002B3AA202|nr:SAP domain-containing protein [Algoriphagus sp. E1-3-M2]MEB2786892.1 SAP domain-containing protein [Algoriphagus sp. E1-3-M2]